MRLGRRADKGPQCLLAAAQMIVGRLELMSRLSWFDLPISLRRLVEQQLGSPVATASSQASGFSPGSADRIVLGDGRRVFIKAVSAAANPDSINIDRREARVLGLLPDGLPCAKLLGLVDTGDWVALILEDVDGHQPTWIGAELDSVLDAVRQLAQVSIPTGQLPSLEQAIADDFAGWLKTDITKLPYDPATNAWVAGHLHELADYAAEGVRRCAGGGLVHGDLRADNILIREDGHAVIVDWPWAQFGSAWFDPVSLLINVLLLRSDIDIDKVLASHPVFTGMPEGTAEALFSGLAAYFTYEATLPAVPGISGLRDFQREQGAVTLGWLRHRINS